MMRDLFAWVALAAAFLIAAIFGYSLIGGDLMKNDPLRTDLTAFPAYMKNGFESGYASVKDPELIIWDLELSPNSTPILMSRLPEDEYSSSHPAFLSPGMRRIEECTILIPFVMSREQISSLYGDNPLSPGIHLAGIGENWAIYLNGSVIARQQHVDAEGHITAFQSRRGVSIPFDRRFINEGDNFLVFHILGARGSPYAGLFHSSPYYIGDYTKLADAGGELLTVSLCTVFVLLGLYHILLYFLRRTDSDNLVFGIFCNLAAIFIFTYSPAVYRVLDNSAIAQRMEYASLYLLLFVLAIFLENLIFGKAKPVTRLYGALSVVVIALQSAFTIWFAIDLRTIWLPCAVAFMLYIFCYSVVYGVVRHLKKPERDFIYLLFVMAAIAATGIFDMLDALFWRSGALLTRYSTSFFILYMTFMLARRYANRFESTTQMKDLLEETVKQRTAQLEEQVVLSEAASRAKSDFLANMSHEIRTPLNAVLGMTAIGAKARDMLSKDHAFVKIKEASNHLLGVINDILDMSKIEAGKLELSAIDFRVREVVAHVEDILRFKTDEKNQKFSVSISDAVPDSLYGDDTRLAQVITNLIGNAVKFTPEQGEISLVAELEDETDGICTVCFRVRDTGIGITEEQKAKLFTAFQQAESQTTRKYGGTGLGLALSKRIVELMGGEIRVESEPGRGSSFSFTIKAPRADMAPQEELSGNATQEMREGEFADKVILLADDVDINREIVIALLEITGVVIDTAENGAKAAELFEQAPERYHLILMDLQMPVMDGYEATRRIRAGSSPQAPSVPIIAMTANVFKEDIEHSLASGMNGHLGKPIELEKLLPLLRKYLS